MQKLPIVSPYTALHSSQPEPISCGLVALLRRPGHRQSGNGSSAELEMFVFDTAAVSSRKRDKTRSVVNS